VETFFEFLVVPNAKNLTTFVFPRVGKLFDKESNATHVGGMHTCGREDVDSGVMESSQRIRDEIILSGGLKTIFEVDRVTGKTMKVVLGKMDEDMANR
jgi:hypothetical protein